MFDAKFSSNDIKKRYSWQAVKKLSEKDNDKPDYTIIKDYIRKHELFKATYKSAMTENLDKGLQIKAQDEIVGKDALTSPSVSTADLVEKFNQLNSDFSSWINKINGVLTVKQKKAYLKAKKGCGQLRRFKINHYNFNPPWLHPRNSA
ncbi:hypothetical protein RhiirC2_792393 [Rhizophagus irregularis]|uniref:Uncharacterized protein n=1 Tax=Rhizophagus irregularis TaxID=588596 RepID=A0A2N1MHE5_9GLOM|nr:hypothetical protein RhiirC2_792393 [Rhizophagus irregularis]